MVPRNWCCLCGEPQYDNVSKPPVRVECFKCVALKVDGIQQLETLLKTQFINTADAKRKCERYVLRKGKRVEGDLRVARKAKGWSQAELAIHLGVSRQAVQQMEIGRRPYGEKAIKWLEFLDENV
jgi:DNA-binding XRE family transcriptional regulator